MASETLKGFRECVRSCWPSFWFGFWLTLFLSIPLSAVYTILLSPIIVLATCASGGDLVDGLQLTLYVFGLGILVGTFTTALR